MKLPTDKFLILIFFAILSSRGFAKIKQPEKWSCRLTTQDAAKEKFNFDLEIYKNQLRIESEDMYKNLKNEPVLLQIKKVDVNNKVLTWYANADVTDYFQKDKAVKSRHILATILLSELSTKFVQNTKNILVIRNHVENESEITVDSAQGICSRPL